MIEYNEVISSFDFDRLEDNLFRSRSPDFGWKRIYGGLLIAHALKAAELTIADPVRQPHSFHGYFLRPGKIEEPLELCVEPLLDGRTLSNRRVSIAQSGKAVFTAQCSFRQKFDGLVHQPSLDDVASPDSLPSEKEIADLYSDRLAPKTLTYLRRAKVFELRPADPEHFMNPEPGKPNPGATWARLRATSKPDISHAHTLMAYLSDMTVLNASLPPHGRNFFDPDIAMASLDHAIWFHETPDWSDWVLMVHEAMGNEGGMGLGRVNIYSRSRRLLATVGQQGLIRLSNDK
jgi:acyl-CoA thioesterase-2